MADDVGASQPLGPQELPGPRLRRGPLRTVVFPLAVIAAIALAIWWLEYRPGSDATSPTGERYGVVELPASLVPTGAEVGHRQGALAPDFLLPLLEGGDLRLSDFRGHPVVVNFWATWCAPCRKEIPQFVAAYDRFRAQGLVIIGVNLQESQSIVRDYAQDYGMDFPIVIDRDGEVAYEYRLLGLPTTFFIDREGVVRDVFAGPFLEKRQGTNVQGAIGESELETMIAGIME